MERYHLVSHLGTGRFGSVWKAIDQTNNEAVAIKRLHEKYHLENECANMEELQSLLILNNHINIMKLKNFIFENNEFFFVLELMDYNLRQFMIKYIIDDKVFKEIQIRNWMSQILQALEHMHMVGYFHRDLKPENLLISKDVIKIADLGSATKIMFDPSYTSNVTTSCYRAPEMLLQSKLQFSNYGAPIDIWAAGIIMIELYTLTRLFDNKGDLDEQLSQTCAIFGAPTKQTWPNGMQMAASHNIKFLQLFSHTTLSQLIPNASSEAINLISNMCSWDPNKRPTASQALQHSFFYQK